MITLSEINKFEEAINLKEDWSRIIAEAGLDISLSYDFVTSLWESHLEKKDIILLIAREEDKIVGILPLIATKDRVLGVFPVNKIGLLTNLFCFHNNFICKDRVPDLLSVIRSYLDTHYADWNVFELSNVSEGSNIMRWLTDSRCPSFLKDRTEDAPYVEICSAWEDYVNNRPKKFRWKLRRIGRELEKDGRLHSKEFFNPEDVDFILDKIFEIEKESWKEKAKISITLDEKQKKFYEIYLKKAASDNNLMVMFLCVGEEYVAFKLTIIFQNMCFLLKTAYKYKFKDNSPGFILEKYLLKKIFDMNFKKYDLLIGNQPWKREWATGIKEAFDIHIYNTRSNYSSFIYHLKKLVKFIKRR